MDPGTEALPTWLTQSSVRDPPEALLFTGLPLASKKTLLLVTALCETLIGENFEDQLLLGLNVKLALTPMSSR